MGIEKGNGQVKAALPQNVRMALFESQRFQAISHSANLNCYVCYSTTPYQKLDPVSSTTPYQTLSPVFNALTLFLAIGTFRLNLVDSS
jgi:hypothetical protein